MVHPKPMDKTISLNVNPHLSVPRDFSLIIHSSQIPKITYKAIKRLILYSMFGYHCILNRSFPVKKT